MQGQLIEFYYLWKKSPAAKNQAVRARQRRPANVILRRIKAPSNGNGGSNGTAKPASASAAASDAQDLSSASENEGDSEEASLDRRELTGYACHHCYTTTSRDWHHAGKDRLILCTDCRVFFKQYGELRPVDRAKTPPPYLFKSTASAEEMDEEGGIRTRGSRTKEETRRRTLTPTPEMERSAAAPKSPSTASTTSTSSSGLDTEPLGKEDIKGTAANLARRQAQSGSGRKKTRKRRRPVADDGTKAAAARKRRKQRLLAESAPKSRASETAEEGGDDESGDSGPNSSPPSVDGDNSNPSSPTNPLHVSQSAPVFDGGLEDGPRLSAPIKTEMGTATVKMEIGDGTEELSSTKRKSPSVYEFSERDELADGLHNSPFKATTSEAAPALLSSSLPKAETSVIQVNLSKSAAANPRDPAPPILVFGQNDSCRFELTQVGDGDENRCCRTYLAFKADPAAPWRNRPPKEKRDKSIKQEERSEARSEASTSSKPIASVQPSPVPASLPPQAAPPVSAASHGPGPGPGLPPWMMGGGHPGHMDPLFALMMNGGFPGMPPFQQGFPGMPNPAALNSPAVQHLRAMAEASQSFGGRNPQDIYLAALHDPNLQSQILDGQLGPEHQLHFAEFVRKYNIPLPPQLEMKAAAILQRLAQQQQAHAAALHAHNQAQQKQQREMEAARQREAERREQERREAERREKERRERERQEKLERERKEREKREREAREERLAAAAAAAAATPAPQPGPSPSVPPSPFLNGFQPNPAEMEFHQRMFQEQILAQQIQQLHHLASQGHPEARQQLALLTAPLTHHTHHHSHAHTHLHLTAQVAAANGAAAAAAADGLKPRPPHSALHPSNSEPASLALHLQASSSRPHLPTSSAPTPIPASAPGPVASPAASAPGFPFPHHFGFPPGHPAHHQAELERLRAGLARQQASENEQLLRSEMMR